jgi:cytochrome c peroxidase
VRVRDIPRAAPAATEAGWVWNVPAGFPLPLVPADNPMSVEKVRLGRALFYDTRLSGTATFACATCHRQELAFTDGRDRAVGSTGMRHPRGSMSLANVAYNATYTWADPRLERLEDQMLVPMLGHDPVELGIGGREAEVLERLRADPERLAMFRDAYPGESDPVTLPNVVHAIATFTRTIVSGGSPYDRYVYHGETTAMSDSAKRGMRLFYSARLKCSECHDGFTFSGPIRFDGAPAIAPTFHNTGLYDLDGAGAYPEDNTGVCGVTNDPADMGRFRAATLRNVAVTAPYMHDGSVATLGEVIDLYAAGGRARTSPLKSPRLTGFALDAREKQDLLAFLDSLTDPGLLSDPALADPRDSR